MCTVVNHFGGTHGSTGLGIIQADAVASAGDVIRLDAISAKCIYGYLTYFMFGKSGNEICFVSITCEADCDIGLPASGDNAERV